MKSCILNPPNVIYVWAYWEMTKYYKLFLCSGKRTYCDKKRITWTDPFKKLFIEKKVNLNHNFHWKKAILNFVIIEENLNWNIKNVWKPFTTCTVWIEWKVWKLLIHRQIQIEWKVVFLQFLNFALREIKMY